MTRVVSSTLGQLRCQEKTVAVVATGWGPLSGGINAFNLDFCLALGRLLKGKSRVVCLTTEVDGPTRAKAAQIGVEILALPSFKLNDHVGTAAAASSVLRRSGIDRLDLTIGHDVFTGPVATILRSQFGGTAALIHHMSYGSYQAVKADGQIAYQKEEEQRLALRSADIVFAVGPLLCRSANDLCQGGQPVRMIVPGLAEIDPVASRAGMFRAITFGRMGNEDDRIKQGSLAAAAFGRFHLKARSLDLPYSLKLNVFGLSESRYAEEEEALKKLVERYAEGFVNVVARKYSQDREELFKHLSRNEVAMMLSWHEGFGLVGWEAIAASVPLIVSRASGLNHLLSDDLGAGLFTAVEIRGSAENDPREEDLDEVVAALLRIAVDLPRALSKAEKLRAHLRARYTWDGCGRDVLDACGLGGLALPGASLEGKFSGPAALQTEGALGSERQDLVLRVAELPDLIRRALRTWDVAQSNALGAELETLLGSVDPKSVPADKLRECYLALYDLEAASVAGKNPVPPQSLLRMKDLLEKSKHVPSN